MTWCLANDCAETKGVFLVQGRKRAKKKTVTDGSNSSSAAHPSAYPEPIDTNRW